MQILICGGTGCKASTSHLIGERLEEALKQHGVADRVEVVTTGCFGFCEKGPIVKIIPGQHILRTSVSRRCRGNRRTAHRGRAESRTPALHRPERRTRRKRLQAHRLLPQAEAHSPAQLRLHRPRGHRRIHCPRRLSGTGRLPAEQEARRGDRHHQTLGPARTRRRRFPHRAEVGTGLQATGRREVRGM